MAEKKRWPRKGSEGRSPKHKAGKRQPRGGLTPEQEEFCRQYVLNGGIGAEAVRTAWPNRRWGHQSAAVRASKLLVVAKIRERVVELTEIARRIAEERFTVRAEDVLAHLKAIAFTSLRDFIEIDDDGQPIVTLKKAGDEALFGLAEITVTDLVKGGRRTKVKLPDRITALVKLGQHVGLFREQVEHKHVHEVIADAAADLDRRLAGLAARLAEGGDPDQLH